MSAIVLEQIEEPEEQLPHEPDPREELQPPETTPEPNEAELVEQEMCPVTGEIVSTPPAPTPKKRGRPPKAKAEAPPAPKVKAAPKPKAVRKPKPLSVEESSDSSDVDTTLRNVYNHVAKPNKKTAILKFLVNWKQV